MRDGRFYRFWVYIMGSRTGTLYTGMTGFLRWQDLAEHWGREMKCPGQPLKKSPEQLLRLGMRRSLAAG